MFHPMTTKNSSYSSSNLSTMRERSQSDRPRTLTRTTTQQNPRKTLWWSSPLTSLTYSLSSQPDIHSPTASRSKKAVNANQYTKCTNCCCYSHACKRCTQKHPSCPYCPLHHTHLAHRCQNPTCHKGGNIKPVLNYCATSTPHYSNCGDDRDTFSRECRARPVRPA